MDAKTAVAQQAQALSDEEKLVKNEFKDHIIKFWKNNQEYAKTMRQQLQIIHRLKKTANRETEVFLELYWNYLQLGEVAISVLRKEQFELSKDQKLKPQAMNWLIKKIEEDEKVYDESLRLYHDFQTINNNILIPKSFIAEELGELLFKLRTKTRPLTQIYLECFEGTSVMTGLITPAEEELGEETI